MLYNKLDKICDGFKWNNLIHLNFLSGHFTSEIELIHMFALYEHSFAV